MKEYKGYTYKLHPTKQQEELIQKTFGACRFIYNQALEWREKAYKDYGSHLSWYDTSAMLTMLKKEPDKGWLNEVDRKALDYSLRYLDTAYKNFFKKRARRPKFKSKHRAKKAYTTSPVKIVSDKSLQVAKVGKIKTHIHCKPKYECRPVSCTVFQDATDEYWATVKWEYEAPDNVNKPKANKVIGLDYKSDGLYVDSNGVCADMPHYYKKAQKKLARQQRILSRRTIGSSNYKKQKHKVAVIHQKIANQRKDFLNKQSAELAKNYDLVAVEDLNMKEIAKKKKKSKVKLGKETNDNGYGMFVNMLEYKLHDNNGALVKVDKYFPSSQLCQCGYKNPITKDLKVRTITCPKCGRTYDRDINAAINVMKEGCRIYMSGFDN